MTSQILKLPTSNTQLFKLALISNASSESIVLIKYQLTPNPPPNITTTARKLFTMSPTTILRLAVRSTRPQARALRLAPTSQLRPLSQTPFLTFPKKGAEDRESINTESSEHTKSSTDAAAAQLDEAYDPKKTSPESEMESTDGEVSLYFCLCLFEVHGNGEVFWGRG
jgi:hypothetical protein